MYVIDIYHITIYIKLSFILSAFTSKIIFCYYPNNTVLIFLILWRSQKINKSFNTPSVLMYVQVSFFHDLSFSFASDVYEISLIVCDKSFDFSCHTFSFFITAGGFQLHAYDAAFIWCYQPG